MEVGQTIENYVIVNHLGRGGMADVWGARDSRLNRMVAIKTIACNLADEADYLTRFREEAQTIAELEHPHILPVYGFGDLEHQMYIVMRYVSGGTLQERLVDGPLPPQEVLRIGRALASALSYAHDHNVIHLDLKPLNVLMDAQALPYLADFGLARRLESGPEVAESTSGSVGYMAPEQMTSGLLDRRTDIFSFGVMLYHMFAGELPFGESSLTAIQILSGKELPDPAEKAEGLPFEAANILRQATALTQADRFERAEEVVEALVQVLESAPGDALTDFSDEDLDYGLEDSDPEALARLEAQDIFFRAQFAWGQGQGQFVLSMPDYMLVNGYYRPGGELAETLDDDGRLLMLRGAVEYDQDIDLWQREAADRDTQREVCLHVLRSGLPPGRARAIRLLADLPDADPPVIVRRVARDLGAESDKAIRAASVALMEKRALPSAGAAWRPAAYTEAIDERLAEEALRDDAPEVAHAAAHAVGRLRSRAGVSFLAAHAATGALARIRDEAPNLPPNIPWGVRTRVFWDLVRRRLSRGALFWRLLIAVIAGAVGFGGMIFVLFPYHQTLLILKRLLNTIGVGVPAGLVIGLMVLLTVEVPARLRSLWAWWVRVPFFWGAGALSVLLAFVYYYMGYLEIADPPWGVLIFGCLVTAGAFKLGSALPEMKMWARVLLALAGTWGALFGSYLLFVNGTLEQPLFYFGTRFEPAWPRALLLSVFFSLAVSVGGYLPDIAHSWLAAVSALAMLAVQALVGLVLVALGAGGTASALLTGLGTLISFAAGGAVVALAGRQSASPRLAGLAALAGGAVYGLAYVILLPSYERLPPDLYGVSLSLDLIQLIGGPLLAGAVGVWVRCRLARSGTDKVSA